MTKVKARYTEAILPEHRGNPLIEALPPKRPWLEVMNIFANYPDYAEEIANHPNPDTREDYLDRIDGLRQPLTEYEKCFRAIERAIKRGYSSKNPLTPTGAQYLHYIIDERPDIKPSTGFFVPKGDGLTLIGESGVGKTSMLEQLLSYFPQVIVHDKYKGINLPEVQLKNQVVWLKVECPDKSSVRDLCEEILSSLDLILEEEKTQPANTIGAMIRQLEQKMKSSHLGLLVIDEMQNLEFKRTGGENGLLKFLRRLVNKLGIPMFFIANPPFDQTLTKELKTARRAESGYHQMMSPLSRESESWNAFIEQLWNYQWTNVYTELTEELNTALHRLSIGNLDMASRTYRETQRLLIGSVDERITPAALESGNSVACGFTQKTSEVIDFKTKLSLPQGRKRREVVHSELKEIKVDKTGDITKPQHAEFASKIIQVMSNVDLLSLVDNPDLFQQAIDYEDPNAYINQKGYLLNDPLSEFS